ncbi:TIGR03086 family metal-binding protein [Streptosporangium sp. NPDC000396]|uniref:TIGR03086 family metal-binding protein n=1 Tax=Streptosporangium sp. NPDC000396 TaxID=3366185 RepID=UPI0036B04444
MTSVINQIDRALDMTGAIVKGVTDDRLAAPALCPGWDVRTELNHLVGGMRIFAAELAGIDAGAAHEDDWLGADPQAAFTTAADLDRDAWHRPDALNRTVRLGFGTVPGPMAALIHLTEVLVHGVDLALATGQQTLVDDAACDELLTIMRGMDFDAFRRPGMFGPELPTPADASGHQRLLAFLGRDLAPH